MQEKAEEMTTTQIYSSEQPEVILQEKSFRRFIKNSFEFFLRLDGLEGCFPSFKRVVTGGKTYLAPIRSSDIYFIEGAPDTSNFWDEPFPFRGKEYFLANTPSLKWFPDFADVIGRFYPGYKAVKDDDGYKLISPNQSSVPFVSNKPRQVIFFGAPGTGKSHAVDLIVKAHPKERTIRTTFHPDSDYSSFVGCYKPTMRNGDIQYAFTPQAFVNAYVGAWSDLSKPFYLVIEEINRGNCAQIFGDIFQLLDRTQEGESSYEIRPDADLQVHLAERLGLIPNIPAEIAGGLEMKLPRNLFILATMNTSDQSLFPIDSAFKRRWDWRFTAIKQPTDESTGKPIDHILDVNGQLYNWTSFIHKVNKKILDLTKSEDKQLGYWFIKPDANRKINWELFVSKAMFYIWNDVVKDYAQMEKEESAFGRNYAFTRFFDELGNPNAEMVVRFLDTLRVERAQDTSGVPFENVESVESANEESEDFAQKKGSKYSYTLAGKPFTGIGKTVQEIITTLGKTMTYEEIESDFNSIVKKSYNGEPGIKPQHPSELNPDENGHNRWYANPFKDKNGKEFSLIALWPDSYFEKLMQFVAHYPEIFPGGLQQHKREG